MAVAKKEETLLRQKSKKTIHKNIQRKKQPAVKIGSNCRLCIFAGQPTPNSGAKLKCNKQKPNVVFDQNKGYWVCHSYIQDKRLS